MTIDRRATGRIGRSALPVASVLAVVIVLWYALALWLNAPQAEQALGEGAALGDRVAAAWSQPRPVLPAPHQVVAEFGRGVFGADVASKRSLVHHAGVTAGVTVLGFVFGTVLGLLLAIGIVHLRTLDRGLMPWIVASQAVPVLAIAPMVIVVLGRMGVSGLVPKALIAAYLSFFPVAIGMAKGLRSPDRLLVDMMRTLNAGPLRLFWSLRLPASMPFLFASLKVGIAASLVGAILSELPTGAVAGLGARLLLGSYYGQTLQIWSALLMASLLGLGLVGIVAAVEAAMRRRTGGWA